jgi:hypothetical protein
VTDDRDLWAQMRREQDRSHYAYGLVLAERQRRELAAQMAQAGGADYTERVLGWWRAKNAPTTHTEPASAAKGGEDE